MGLNNDGKGGTVRLMNPANYITVPDVLHNEAHVWFCLPDKITDAEKLAYYKSLLCDEERQQLERFHFKKDQHSYLVSHALVRTVLSKYADLSPSQWLFSKTKQGRPEIKQATIAAPLKFNLTHTPGLCACVVTLGAQCGVDAEIIKRKNNLQKIAERMFATAELNTMKKLHGANHRKTFYQFWTLREAYVKALGTGLAGSSKNFYFSLNAGDASITIENTANKPEDDNDSWQFVLFEPTQNHISSIALKKTTAKNLTIISHTIDP